MKNKNKHKNSYRMNKIKKTMKLMIVKINLSRINRREMKI